MTKSIGVRIDEDLLERIEKIKKEDNLDRSTVIRKLLEKGYDDYILERTAKKYEKGEITISKAAEKSNTTIWKMQKYLVKNGYQSEYSIKDLEKETKQLKQID